MQRFRSYVPAGVLLPLFILALLLSVALLGGKWSGHHGAAPADAAASPTPGAGPGGSATVSVRNTLFGQPFITWVSPLSWAIVDGNKCSRVTRTIAYQTVLNSDIWPWDNEPPCNLTGVPVSICYGAWTVCSEEFVFTGEDFTVDIEWSSDPRHDPGYWEAASTVTARFGHAGVEQPVTFLAFYFQAGAVNCGSGGSFPVTLSSVTAQWPLKSHPACSVHGTDIFVRVITEEFGELEGSFQWQGEDVVVEIDTGALLATPSPTSSPAPTPTPSAATPTPAPSGEATATPASLPEAGGPPAGTRSGAALLVAAAGLLGALALIRLGVRRRRA